MLNEVGRFVLHRSSGSGSFNVAKRSRNSLRESDPYHIKDSVQLLGLCKLPSLRRGKKYEKARSTSSTMSKYSSSRNYKRKGRRNEESDLYTTHAYVNVSDIWQPYRCSSTNDDLDISIPSSSIDQLTYKRFNRRDVIINPEDLALAIVAAEVGDLSSVKTFIKKRNIPIDARNRNGESMLHSALKKDRLNVVKYLLNRGCNMETLSEIGSFPLHFVASNGAAKCLKFLLKCFISDEKKTKEKQMRAVTKYNFLFQCDDDGNNPLHMAAKLEAKCLKILLQNIILTCGWPAAEEALQHQNIMGQSPLHLACIFRNINGVNILTKDCDKAIAKVCPFGKAKKIAEKLRNASLRTLYWPTRSGNFIQDISVIKCACKKELISDHYGTITGFTAGQLPKTTIESQGYDVIERRCTSCDRGILLIMKLLVSYCPQISNMLDKHGQTPLMCAVINDASGIVHALLNEGVNIETVDNRFHTALHHAATRGTVRQVRTLLSSCASPNAADDCGATPLHYAAVRGYISSLKFLYKSSEFKDKATINGHTAFMWAAMNGTNTSLRAMLDLNPTLNRKNVDNNGSTALHLAAARDLTDTVRFLVRYGWDMEGRNNFGENALIVAASRGCTKTVRVLLDFGSDVFALDKEENSTLHVCCDTDQKIEVVQELLTWLQGSPLLNHRNLKGKTPLHIAIENRALYCVYDLMRFGASLRIKDVRGYDALMLAIESGSWPMITNLLRAHPNVNNFAHYDSHSTLTLARHKHNYVLAAFLKANGALLPDKLLDNAASKIQHWYRFCSLQRRISLEAATHRSKNSSQTLVARTLQPNWDHRLIIEETIDTI